MVDYVSFEEVTGAHSGGPGPKFGDTGLARSLAVGLASGDEPKPINNYRCSSCKVPRETP